MQYNDGAWQTGMTIRDYFAAKAMQAIIAADTQWSINNDVLAQMAYDKSDAMLRVREGGAA